MLKFCCAFLLACLLSACSEPAFRVHEKLDSQLQEDLKVMVAEVIKGSGKDHLLAEPYFEIKDLRFFTGDTAKKYSGYAEVDFYYYRDIGLYQKRKYRYDVRKYYWDRYYKKMMFIHTPAPVNSATKPGQN